MAPSPNTERSEFASAHGIDYAWSSTTKLPESMGWTFNHIITMLVMDDLKNKREVSNYQAVLVEAVAEDATSAAEAYKDVLTKHIFGKLMKEILNQIPNNEEFELLNQEILRLLAHRRKGILIHSQDWRKLKSMLATARGHAASLQNPQHRNTLDFILKACTWATQEETPTSYANILREMANAYECIGFSAAKAYQQVLQVFLEKAIPKQRKLARKSKRPLGPQISPTGQNLLKQLGTFSPVKDHHHK